MAAEAADVIYFMMTRCVAAGVGLREIEKHLDRRSLKVYMYIYVCTVCMYVCIYMHMLYDPKSVRYLMITFIYVVL